MAKKDHQLNSDRQVILISGGSRGLGQALVSAFLQRGHIVATYSRKPSEFIKTCIANDPDQVSFAWQELDATNHERVKEFVIMVAQRYGRIDVLINNAALIVEQVLALTRPAEIHDLIKLNLEAPILLAQACSKIMLQQRSGNIINISSIDAIRGFAGVSAYSATKAALDGFTRSLARELGSRGIRVNSVAPGFFESIMVQGLTAEQRERIVRRTPLGRLATVEDIIGGIQFLISPDAGFITGQTLVIDGGITC